MDSSGMYDSQVQNETCSEEFVLHARLPSLQEMAYNRIAIAVWCRYCLTPRQQVYKHHPDTVNELELMDCYKLIKTLAMPRFMKEILNKCLKRVRKETIRCTRYFRDELLSENLVQYRMRQVDWEHFVWCPDGRIDYKSTAIKMLHSGVLTEVQKFAIVSNFCLENEVKIFDLNRRSMKNFIRKVYEGRDPLLFYWICYLKNELHRIEPFFNRCSDGHVEPILNLIYNENQWSCAFEYFWNRLNAEDQVSSISNGLYATWDYSTLRWSRSLFYKMSHDQLTNLLRHKPVAMISAFLEGMEMPEWAITAWKRCKNWLHNEQFVDLLRSLLAPLNKNHILRQECKMSVLLEIWNTANDQHKNYAVRPVSLVLKTVCHRILSVTNSFQSGLLIHDPRLWNKLAPSTFKFLSKFLSLTSADYRKKLILEGDPSFIFYFDFHVVHEVFQLCLPNFQGELELTNKPSKCIIRPYYCKILYSGEDYDELNRRLLRSFQNLNISSNDALKKFIESLIVANKREMKTLCRNCNGDELTDLIRLSEFINKILQENVSTVLKMKQSYFFSLSCASSDPYERYGSLYELSKLIEQEFVLEHLQELKRRFAERLQTASVDEWGWYVRDYGMFAGVFSWCFENDEEMFLQVKRCIPMEGARIFFPLKKTKYARKVKICSKK